MSLNDILGYIFPSLPKIYDDTNNDDEQIRVERNERFRCFDHLQEYSTRTRKKAIISLPVQRQRFSELDKREDSKIKSEILNGKLKIELWGTGELDDVLVELSKSLSVLANVYLAKLPPPRLNFHAEEDYKSKEKTFKSVDNIVVFISSNDVKRFFSDLTWIEIGNSWIRRLHSPRRKGSLFLKHRNPLQSPLPNNQTLQTPPRPSAPTFDTTSSSSVTKSISVKGPLGLLCVNDSSKQDKRPYTPSSTDEGTEGTLTHEQSLNGSRKSTSTLSTTLDSPSTAHSSSGPSSDGSDHHHHHKEDEYTPLKVKSKIEVDLKDERKIQDFVSVPSSPRSRSSSPPMYLRFEMNERKWISISFCPSPHIRARNTFNASPGGGGDGFEGDDIENENIFNLNPAYDFSFPVKEEDEEDEEGENFINQNLILRLEANGRIKSLSPKSSCVNVDLATAFQVESPLKTRSTNNIQNLMNGGGGGTVNEREGKLVFVMCTRSDEAGKNNKKQEGLYEKEKKEENFLKGKEALEFWMQTKNVKGEVIKWNFENGNEDLKKKLLNIF